MATPLFTRWFQSQVFSPGFRLHQAADGGAAPWQSPALPQKVLVDFIRLRRRLTPYAESTGAGLPLSKKDTATRVAPPSLNDYARTGEHLHPLSFGPSFLVQPVPATESPLLRLSLPAGAAWVDFWTGAAYRGDQVIRTPAPLEIIPAFVRAGSIIPLAPLDSKPDEPGAPLEIRVYPGADGSFVLQDAAGAVKFTWDDRANTLRIGSPDTRRASRSIRRRFGIVVVRPGRGVGLCPPTRTDSEAEYTGAELALTLSPPPARPHSPKGFSATVDSRNVVFTWQAPCDGAIYRLKRVAAPGGIFEDIASALSETRHVLPVSACDQSFECVVTAMNAGGESFPSSVVKVAIPASAMAERRLAPRLVPVVQASPVASQPTGPARQTTPPLSDLVAGARGMWAAASTSVLVASRLAAVAASTPPTPSRRGEPSPVKDTARPRPTARKTALPDSAYPFAKAS